MSEDDAGVESEGGGSDEEDEDGEHGAPALR